MSLPTILPPSLKQVSHFMKVASEHDVRDPVVAYWARFHAVQKSLTIDKSSAPAKAFIIQLLDWLEVKKKKDFKDNEAVTNESVGQAHVENYALKLFKYADDCDRRGVFNKNTIKSFYTSSMLIDVLENFGPVDQEFEKMRKYGKWKAAYIHNCLKNGETPVGGPMEGGEDDFEQNEEEETVNISEPAPAPAPLPIPTFTPTPIATATTLPAKATLAAQKYTKFASSALNFDDIPTAIINLKKALHLLETGMEMPE